MIDNINFALLCYNEGYTIKTLIEEIFEIAKQYNFRNFDIIIVDDGSDEFTKSVLRELKTIYPDIIRIITHQRNLGYGAAHRSALLACDRKWILYTDGDGQYPISNIQNLLTIYDKSIHFYTGIRKNRDGFIRKIVTKIYNLLLRTMFGMPSYDFGCAFRLINHEVLKDTIPLCNSGFSSAEQIIRAYKSGIKIRQTDIIHKKRVFEHSRTFNFLHILRIICDIVKLRWDLSKKRQ